MPNKSPKHSFLCLFSTFQHSLTIGSSFPNKDSTQELSWLPVQHQIIQISIIKLISSKKKFELMIADLIQVLFPSLFQRWVRIRTMMAVLWSHFLRSGLRSAYNYLLFNFFDFNHVPSSPPGLARVRLRYKVLYNTLPKRLYNS